MAKPATIQKALIIIDQDAVREPHPPAGREQHPRLGQRLNEAVMMPQHGAVQHREVTNHQLLETK